MDKEQSQRFTRHFVDDTFFKMYVDQHTKRQVQKMPIFKMFLTVVVSSFNQATMAEDQEFIWWYVST